MNILIVEDEKLAFEKLALLLQKIDLEITDLVHASSIKSAVELINKTQFNLAFFDIELADGLSFEILEQTKVDFPIIFTTAYNQYAIQAFKHNSIDYLLKPIAKSELEKALYKYEKYWKNKSNQINEKKLIEDFKTLLSNNYKKRFTIKIGEHIRIVETKDIRLVYSQNKANYFRTSKDVLIDHSLDKIMELLSPKAFFRISRKHIVALEFITDIISYSNSRLEVVLDTDFDEDLIVSREKVQAFKLWLESE